MNLHRRDVLSGLGGFAASTAFRTLPVQRPAAHASSPFPRKADFAIPDGLTYLNGAYTHPMPVAAVEAVSRHAGRRSRPGGMAEPGNAELTLQVKEEFAALINARPAEISFVPNTSTEPRRQRPGSPVSGSVVTDALH